jgi:ABC-2 type transport system permease protein
MEVIHAESNRSAQLRPPYPEGYVLAFVRAQMRTYGQLARAGFRRQATYRLAMLAGLVTNIVFGFIRAAILFAAVDSAGGTLAGYTRDTISTYVWLSQGLLGAVNLGGSGASELSERIRSGDVAVDFTRPVDVQGSYLATDLGRAAFTFLPRGLPSVLVGALTMGLALPSNIWPYLLGLVSVTLAVSVSFLCGYAVNILGFWLVETRGVRSLYAVTSAFLAGLFVPVGMFPGWLSTLALATPFPSMLQVPIDIISAHVSGMEAVKAVAAQCFWVALTFLVGGALTRAGRHKLEVQGG